MEKEIEKIRQEVDSCKKCDLWKTRNKPVARDGSEKAEITFVEEALGYMAAGFMVYISVEELIPAARIKQNLKVSIISIILGAVVVLLTNLLI